VKITDDATNTHDVCSVEFPCDEAAPEEALRDACSETAAQRLFIREQRSIERNLNATQGMSPKSNPAQALQSTKPRAKHALQEEADAPRLGAARNRPKGRARMYKMESSSMEMVWNTHDQQWREHTQEVVQTSSLTHIAVMIIEDFLSFFPGAPCLAGDWRLRG
jgi:hypothetical protein